MPTLAPIKTSLNRGEQLAALLCLGVAALMCGTACYTNVNLQLMDSKPVPAPAAPRASQSAATLKPGAFRMGFSADGAGFSPKSGEGTSVGQGSVGARIGFAPKGLELDAGIAFPLFQPYGLARFQAIGQGAEKGPFVSAEAGGGVGDAFGGAVLGMPLDQFWEVQVDGHGGSYYGDGYGEAGLGVVLHAGDNIDLIAGTGYRYYATGLRPNVTRGGVSVEFGPALKTTHLQAVTELYHNDPELLLNAGELRAAELACLAKLKNKTQARRSELWELYGRILQAKGDLRGARRAIRKAYQLKPAPAPIQTPVSENIVGPSTDGHDPEQ